MDGTVTSATTSLLSTTTTTTTTTPPGTTVTTVTNPTDGRPWLDETISIHLHLARKWLQEKAIKKENNPKANPNREWAGIYEDNGSSLDIINPDTPGTLQVIDENPLTLTDGEATIRASLGHNTSIASSLARGHCIALHKYTVRHTAYGPSRDRILLVPETLGQPKAPHLRLRPTLQHITECERVVSALQDLQDARIALDRRCFLSPAEPADDSMAPRPRHETRVSQSSPNTQIPFDTQIPPRSPTAQREVQHVGTRSREPVLAGNTRREELHTRNSDSDDQGKQMRLLQLLQAKQNADSNPPLDVAGHNAQEAASHVPTQASAQPARDTVRSKDTSLPSSANRKRVAEAAKAGPIQTSNEDLDESIIDQILDNATLTSSNGEQLDDSIPSWLNGCEPVCGSAKVHNRQEEILNHPESWHKPEVGLRFPDANIPVEILAALKIKLRSSGEHTTISSIEPTQATVPDDQSNVHSIQETHNDIMTTQDSDPVSWPSSPAPEPPKSIAKNHIGLPPDSSFEATNANPTEEPRKSIPPSSPPLISAVQESENEMELDVPRGLDDKSSIAGSQPTRARETIQVKETPDTKGTKAQFARCQSDLHLDDPYKGASSHSVICCTYDDVQSQHPNRERSGPVGSPTDDVTMEEAEEELPKQDITTHSPSKLGSEVAMSPASPARKPAQFGANTPGIFRHSSLVEQEKSPINKDGRFTREGDVDENIHLDSPMAFSKAKRKLEHSPSKKNSRESKRREIKVSSLGPPSPVRDLDTMLREEKRRSFRSFREQKKFDSAAAQLPQSTRMDTSVDTESGASPQNSMSPENRGMSKSPLEPSPAVRNSAQHRRHITRVDSRSGTALNTSFLSMQERLEDINIDMDLYEHPTPEQKPKNHRSRLPSPMDIDVSSSHAPRSVQGPHSSSHHSSHQERAQRISFTPATIFQQFRAAYPDYTGDHKHFSNLCKQMESLDREDKMVPKWQWDDYIVRSRSHYTAYVAQCVEDGEEVEPYHRFYKDHIHDTIHTQGIIKNRQTLLNALEEMRSFTNSQRGSSSFDGASNSHSLNRPISRGLLRHPNQKSCPDPTHATSSDAHESSDYAAWNEGTPQQAQQASKQTSASVETPPISSTARKKKRRTLPAAFTPNMTSTLAASSKPSPFAHPNGQVKDASRQSRYSFQGSAFNGSHHPSRAPPHHDKQYQQPKQQAPPPSTLTSTSTPTGDPFRDFVRGYEAVTSLTGSTQIDPTLPWPENLHVRPSIAAAEKRTYDVLEWGDVL